MISELAFALHGSFLKHHHIIRHYRNLGQISHGFTMQEAMNLKLQEHQSINGCTETSILLHDASCQLAAPAET